ncbi:MAG: hypothetical protein H6662_02515 [Ardenticatenaceae bacterium]|nr:hypothetical protein [Anaerolineales bacterium]MCB8920432.1 hypothetical protein [Ardenticatenaceae bacterium]MCB8989387.1 hypothetical protein [Ardenticatenaceae bacterium]MCB9004542.1 hypothetical protein [Ardenticatenaceae bacterium]
MLDRMKENETAVFPKNRILTLILTLFFSLLGMAGCLLAFLMLLGSAAEPGETYFEMLPFLMGLIITAVGGILMSWLRQRLRIGWTTTAITLLLWLVGTALLFFGGTAVFLYDEPAEFMSNLGFAMALCIVPGGLLTLFALALYGYSAWRGNQSQAKAAPDEAEWIETLKEQEKYE